MPVPTNSHIPTYDYVLQASIHFGILSPKRHLTENRFVEAKGSLGLVSNGLRVEVISSNRKTLNMLF